MNSYALIRSPIEDALRRLFAECERGIFIASPFISAYGISVLIDTLSSRIHDVKVEILTSISVKSLQEGNLDLIALIHLCQVQPLTKILSLPQLHAKVYVVDDRKAIITSANFTQGGLMQNYEYGIALFDAPLVAGISHDMRAYANLGSVFTLEALKQLADDARELRAAQKDAERAQRQSDIGKRLRQQMRAIENALLQNRVRERPITAIFAETIQYLLRFGPMTTKALHTRIKDIHPDICDDTIDRVIGGQRFGKLWKHHVRNAQQFLKRRGKIVLRNGYWELT